MGGPTPASKPAEQARVQVKPEAAKGPVKTVFRLDAVDNANMYLHDKPMPYMIKTDMSEIEMKCELCLELPCCPDHCCDWDTCECGHCEQCGPKNQAPEQKQRPGSAYRKVFNPKTWNEDFVETDEPEIYIRGDISR
mmetsp:Transcript_6894/g.8228  ORF Transcript_6894/g.8228 Transcript_6894/m.8228 type:complete len:137 (+) Transcript_6894:239-649(+)